MKNRCRINYIDVINIPSVMISYQLGLQKFPWYSLTTSYTDPLHLSTILMGVGNVCKSCAHVDIIDVYLKKFIVKC